MSVHSILLSTQLNIICDLFYNTVYSYGVSSKRFSNMCSNQ